jgi:hypothetical protein
MATHNVATSTNYIVQFDDGDPNNQAQGMATAIAGIVESEHSALTSWFNITTGFGTSDRITVNVKSISSGGANNFGYSSGGGSVINVNFLPTGFTSSQNTANEVARMMFVNELVEIFMDFNNQKSGNTTWVAGHSDGEGLSQICGIIRFPVGHYAAYRSWVNNWLSSSRPNWVSSNESTDGNAVSFGCALLFLYYLRDQLGFTIQQIIQNGGATLVDLYKNLTGDNSDPFAYFANAVNSVLPGTQTLPESNTEAADDPFPIFTLNFWDGKNTYGKAEVQDSINNIRPFQDAVLLVLEGFSPSHWQALGSPVPANPTGDAALFPDIHFTRTHVEFENSSLPLVPQRIHFHYDVSFTTTSGFTTAPQVKELDSSITVSGTPANATTDFEFLGAENPYFSNVKPGVDNVPWLSDDLRVFTAIPRLAPVPVPGGPTFSTDSIDGARAYLGALLDHLNQNFGDASLTDPFDPGSNVIPEQQNAFAGDSSVLPNLTFLGQNGDTYNFAIARVRMRGPIGDTSNPVKVFFRMWQSQSPDTDFQDGGTYNSHHDSLGLPDWPLPAPDNSTFPFFASSNAPNFTNPNNTEFGIGGVNNQIITVNSGAGQWRYFGCLLNVYDSSYLVNSTPVTQLLPGTHHCLVAQIAYDDAPILSTNGVTVSPGNSDKLAQRNLQISQGFNPGVPPSNRVPQTFDIRRSHPGNSDFDELMIDWGNLPIGTVASIYWPQVNASQVVQLASQRYGHHELSAADAHTIQCKVVRHLSYVPIPPGTGDKFAGLLTVDLPQTVKKGQSFTIVARRITTYTAPPPVVIQSPGLHAPEVNRHRKGIAQEKVHKPKQAAEKQRSWRYITGAFQVNIPIQADADILPYDMNTLSIFKWRLSKTPATNRWYAVIKRYIEILSARIDGLGGNAGSIPASSTGLTEPAGVESKQHMKEYTGKICEIFYDCFGDFEGFKLSCCSGGRAFASREKGIEEVVLYACRKRQSVSVFIDDGCIRKIVLRC